MAAQLLGREVKTISYDLYSSDSTFPHLRDTISHANYH